MSSVDQPASGQTTTLPVAPPSDPAKAANDDSKAHQVIKTNDAVTDPDTCPLNAPDKPADEHGSAPGSLSCLSVNMAKATVKATATAVAAGTAVMVASETDETSFLPLSIAAFFGAIATRLSSHYHKKWTLASFDRKTNQLADDLRRACSKQRGSNSADRKNVERVFKRVDSLAHELRRICEGDSRFDEQKLLERFSDRLCSKIQSDVEKDPSAKTTLTHFHRQWERSINDEYTCHLDPFWPRHQEAEKHDKGRWGEAPKPMTASDYLRNRIVDLEEVRQDARYDPGRALIDKMTCVLKEASGDNVRPVRNPNSRK